MQRELVESLSGVRQKVVGSSLGVRRKYARSSLEIYWEFAGRQWYCLCLETWALFGGGTAGAVSGTAGAVSSIVVPQDFGEV
ncbi:hypothetical protein B296_00026706 [Ensete ventricosum]|uniref:Uncharacterized protein n=1 Tax=Ensete ventricosum TaxID=4639 RepID=A0A426YG43_ENSVE|nr:hypothetical protein B296_00026706 [Ensete ventricosum]